MASLLGKKIKASVLLESAHTLKSNGYYTITVWKGHILSDILSFLCDWDVTKPLQKRSDCSLVSCHSPTLPCSLPSLHSVYSATSPCSPFLKPPFPRCTSSYLLIQRGVVYGYSANTLLCLASHSFASMNRARS